MKPFTDKVIQIIKNIPKGKVMTYGQIARTAGRPRAARQVVRILHSMGRKYSLPWHRVINARGQIAIKDEEGFFNQLSMLQDEGVDVSKDGKVDLEVYLYSPEPIIDEEM